VGYISYNSAAHMGQATQSRQLGWLPEILANGFFNIFIKTYLLLICSDKNIWASSTYQAALHFNFRILQFLSKRRLCGEKQHINQSLIYTVN